MAPDHVTLRAAEELPHSHLGSANLGHSNAATSPTRHIWAEFLETRRSPIRAAVELPTMRLACTCPATRFPCRHTLALLMAYADGRIPLADAPDWLTELLPEADAVPEPDRRDALMAGMADLRLRLADVAAQGLAALPRRGRALWADAADRLVDAYALEAAREVRQLAAVAGSGADWPERLLPRLGRLALLCNAFSRLDALSSAEQGDAIAAVGRWPQGDAEALDGRWLVIGRTVETEHRQWRSRTWLYGVTSGRWAVVADASAAGRQAAVCLPVGAAVNGQLHFHPSVWPVNARPTAPLRLAADVASATPPKSSLATGAVDIGAAVALYSAALAANPWLRVYPMALRDVVIEPPYGTRAQWRVRDRDGRVLPLPDGFAHGWRLLSLAADRPLTLFGEWDGETLAPLSVWQGGWRSLAAWRGLA